MMSDLLAAILFGQLQRADEINDRRLKIWNRYHSGLASWAEKYGVKTPFVPESCEHVGHVYHLRFEKSEHRTKFVSTLKNQQINCVFHFQALNTSPDGQSFGGYVGKCPVAEHASDCLVRLPLYNTLTESDQTRVIEATTNFTP